ncbi:MAG TPA: PAS domain S-box protein, partial [Sphingobacteriaceae bacterium]
MPAVVLRADERFTIAEVNGFFLKNAQRSREDLLGRGLFEIFPGDGVPAMTESFNRVIRNKVAERLPHYRSDIPGSGGRGSVKRYWSPHNIPIPDDSGEVRYILHAVTDMTAEVELGEVHQKNKQEYQSLFEQHPDVVFSLDLDGYFTQVNQAAVQLSERTEAELLSMHFSELSLVGDAARLESYFRQCCAGAAFNVEVPAISKSGKRHELDISIMPLMINGRVQGIYGIAKDETERHRFQKERQLITQISQIFNRSGDLSACLSGVLEAFCEFTGTRVGEAWIGSIDQTEVIRVASVRRGRDIRLDGKVWFNEPHGLVGNAWHRRKTVEMHDLRNNSEFGRPAFAGENGLEAGMAVPVISNDQVVAVIAFYSEAPGSIPVDWMTEGVVGHLAGEIRRKKAEQELNQFFNLSPDMLAIVGFDGYFKKVNAMFTQLLGYSEEELTAKPFYEFIHPDDRAGSEAALKGLKSSLLLQPYENRYITKTGQTRWISWAANISRDDRLFYAVAREITEKKELEKAIQSEQLRFSRMFNEAPVSMCILKGPDHVYTHVNAAFYAFTGKSGIEGKSVLEAFPEVENQGIPEWMNHVYRTGETFTSADTPLELMRDGKLEPCYLTFMYQPYKNSDGEVEGIFYFGIDVTEQVLARKRLEESERRYVDLIENLPVAVYTTDAEGNMLLYNRAAVELWGSRPEIGNQSHLESIQIFSTEGEPLPHHQRPLASALINGKPAWNPEVVLKRTDGELRNVLACPSPVFDAAGTLYGGINVLIDITERKQAEEEIQRLSLIARNTDNAVIITDLDGRIEWVNDAFTKMTEFPFREAAGRAEASLLYGEHTDPSVSARIADMNRQGKVFQCEILNYTRSGRPFWREVLHQPLFNRNGNVTNYMSISRDVTERKEAYQKLVQSRKEIQSFARQLNDVLEDERARIAREIHDEFGQQLAGLKMYLLSLRGYLADGGEAVLESTMSAADATIQSLRRFATELRPGILDTLGLVPSIEWLVEDFKAKSGISCRIRLKGETRRNIEKNISICCFRICQEALTNIIKHAGASRVTAELEVTADRLFMRIADNGRG